MPIAYADLNRKLFSPRGIAVREVAQPLNSDTPAAALIKTSNQAGEWTFLP